MSREKKIEKYASMLLALSLDKNISKEELLDIAFQYPVDLDSFFFAMENPSIANSIIHKMHMEDTSIREDAIELLASSRDNVIEVIIHDYVIDTATTMEVPEDIKTYIKNLLRMYEADIKIIFGLTWYHDHVDRWDGFTEENIKLYIYYLSDKTKDEIIKILKENFKDIDIL